MNFYIPKEMEEEIRRTMKEIGEKRYSKAMMVIVRRSRLGREIELVQQQFNSKNKEKRGYMGL